MRDLDVLRQKGYPIETDQGRGGGVRLHRHWGIGRLQLNYREVIDLLLSLAIMEKIGSPVFLGSVKAIRHKIASSFPQEQRSQIQSLRNRIVIGGTATGFALDSLQETPKSCASAVYDAFFEKKLLSIVYQDAEGKGTNRVIEAQYLFLHWPIWYVLAWDHLRADVRCFRLDRINEAKVEGGVFKSKNKVLFTKGMEDFISNL
jgi:predicted DNA-binding transcriptional regulator YafY